MFRGMWSFYPERGILAKERASGSYYISAYFLAKSLSEIPLTTAFPTIYLMICYPMSNSNPLLTSFLGTALTQSVTNLCAESVGLLIGAATGDTKLGVMYGTLSALALMVVGGFFVRNIPPFLQWLLVLSPLKYAYIASIQFEFTGSVPCDGSNVLAACEGRAGGVATREEILQHFDADGSSVWFNIGMIMVLTLGCRIMAYGCLRFLKFNQGRE
jgi:ABC-type multidrug transport system permease subunit